MSMIFLDFERVSNAVFLLFCLRLVYSTGVFVYLLLIGVIDDIR